MSNYYDDIRLGDTIDVKFTSRAFATGAPTTLAGSPAIAAYVGNSTTEITAGITLTVDFDSRTGLNNVRVVASGGNGFATATNVELVITAGTVGGVSVVGECVGAFSIEARSALMPTTAARTLDVSATGEAGIDWANVGAPTTTLNLSGTTIATVTGSVGSVTGTVGSVTSPVTVGTVNDKTGYTLSATGSAALTEGYRANGGTGTLAQLLYEIVAHLGESSIAGTTKTIKKLDHATTAEVFTLDDADAPSSVTRAS